MTLDEDPKDEVESYPCVCGGTIVKNEFDVWECDTCGYIPAVEGVDV